MANDGRPTPWRTLTLRPNEPPDGELDGGQGDEGGQGFGEILEAP